MPSFLESFSKAAAIGYIGGISCRIYTEGELS